MSSTAGPPPPTGPGKLDRASRRERLAALRLAIALTRTDDATAPEELAAVERLAGELGVALRPGDLSRRLDVEHVAAWVRDPELRERVLGELVAVALADGRADPLELALIRSLADRWALARPAAPGVDWGAVEVPPDLAAQLASRVRAPAEARARASARPALVDAPAEPADATPDEPALPVDDVEQQPALELAEVARLLDEPAIAPVIAKLDLDALARHGLMPVTDLLLEVSGLGWILLPVGLIAMLAALANGPAPFVATAAVVVVVMALLPGLRAVGLRRTVRRLEEGVFVHAVVESVRAEVQVSDDGERFVHEEGQFVYRFEGVERRVSITARRPVGGPGPGLRVGRRDWFLVHPSDPVQPIPIGALEQVATLRLPGVVAPAARDAAGLRGAGRVTVDVQAAQRCPFCLDGVAGVAPAELMTCGACRVVFHRECLVEAARCSTVGCRNNRSA